jgi:hypothetical protein
MTGKYTKTQGCPLLKSLQATMADSNIPLLPKIKIALATGSQGNMNK